MNVYLYVCMYEVAYATKVHGTRDVRTRPEINKKPKKKINNNNKKIIIRAKKIINNPVFLCVIICNN